MSKGAPPPPRVGAPVAGKVPRPVALREYRYVDRDVERTVSFPVDGSNDVAGTIASGSSREVREYQDKLKCISLRQRGDSKTDIAAKLGRSEHWVKRWWRMEPALVERPASASGRDIVMQKASLASFRDLDIKRGFLQQEKDREVFNEAAQGTKWRQAKAVRRDLETGQLVLSYDSKGRSIDSGRHVADYNGGVPGLDKLLQRVFSEANIRDPQARVFMNYYKDGQARTGTHRHDFWTCLVSLGADRILTVDNQPILMRDGDLIIFGTQNHGVPVMPEVTDGRISLVIFFYPDSDNLERQWQTIEDGEEQLGEEQWRMENSAETPTLATGCDSKLQISLLWGDQSGSGGAGGHEITAVLGGGGGDILASVLDEKSERRSLLKSPNSHLTFYDSCAASSDASTATASLTVFAIAAVGFDERGFFARLSKADIGQLWDTRSTDALRGMPSYSEPSDLRGACARRSIIYRTAQLGRRAAGGIEAHLASEEGQDALRRISIAARSGRPLAVLGALEDWRKDDRRLICDALMGVGSGDIQVCHLGANGQEFHPRPCSLPAHAERTVEAVARGGKPCADAADHIGRPNDVDNSGAAGVPHRSAGDGGAAAPAGHRAQNAASSVEAAVAVEPPVRASRWNRRGRTADPTTA